MDIAIYILCGFSALDLLLSIISYKKEQTTFSIITSTALFPLFTILSILLMTKQYPDTLHTMIICGLVTVFTFFASFFITTENQKFKNIAKISFILSNILWISLFETTRYIYRIPTIFNIILTIIYVGIALIVFSISGKQKKLFYIYSLILIFTASLLNYFSLVTLCFGRTLNSVVLFIGTTANLIFNLSFISNYPKMDLKKEKLFRFILLIASQTLTAYSNVVLFLL